MEKLTGSSQTGAITDTQLPGGDAHRVSHASGWPAVVFAANVHLEVFVPF